MKLLAALITTVSLTGLSWAACPLLAPPNSAADQKPALEDLRNTGFEHYQKGHYQESAACYAEALRGSQVLGMNDFATVTDLSNMGDLTEEMGVYPEAKNYYLKALDVLTHLEQADSGAAGDLYAKLGILMQVQGWFSEAETNYKKALALLTRHVGPESWRTANTLNRLGRVYLELGNLPQASSLIHKALAIAKKNPSENNPLLITFFDSEAYLLCRTAKYREAEKDWLTALRIAERTYGADGFQYGFLLLHLGQMYLIVGDYPAAETMLRRAVASKTQVTGSDPIDRALLFSSLATVYVKQRKLADAEPVILETRELVNSNCAASPMACSLVRSNLGECYMTKGQWEPAEMEFKAALKLREDILGDHPLVANSLTSLAGALRKMKRKGEAKMYEEQAARIVSSQRNPLYDDGNTVDVRTFRAANH